MINILTFPLVLTLVTADPGKGKPVYADTTVVHPAGSVKVFPTPYNTGSITIRSGLVTMLSFYLFDLDGKLVHKIDIHPNQNYVLEGLSKGVYTYNVFNNDQKLEGGNIRLK